jgi:hypothetical protein
LSNSLGELKPAFHIITNESLKIMNWKLKSTSDLSSLESAVATAAQAVAETKAATRATWDKVKDFRAAIEDAPDSPALAAGLREAEAEHRVARDADERAHAALMASERALVVAREVGPRADLAASLKARKAKIEALSAKLVPLLREFEAEVIETYSNELLWSVSGGTKTVHESLPDHLDFLVGYLSQPGGLPQFLAHMGDYAAGVVDGSRKATLGANYIKDRRAIRKAG